MLSVIQLDESRKTTYGFLRHLCEIAYVKDRQVVWMRNNN